MPIFREGGQPGATQLLMVDGSWLLLATVSGVTAEVAEFGHAHGGGHLRPSWAWSWAMKPAPCPLMTDHSPPGKVSDVEEARRFAQESGCDWLSVAVDTVHGVIGPARAIRRKSKRVLAPDNWPNSARPRVLVLHGGSGIKQEFVLASFKHGITKSTSARKSLRRTSRPCGRPTMSRPPSRRALRHHLRPLDRILLYRRHSEAGRRVGGVRRVPWPYLALTSAPVAAKSVVLLRDRRVVDRRLRRIRHGTAPVSAA